MRTEYKELSVQKATKESACKRDKKAGDSGKSVNRER
jgi:hypothetical protein